MMAGLLAVNFILTALFAAVRASRRKSFGTAVLFLFLPYLGFIIYFVPSMLQRLLGAARYDRESLVQRFQIDPLAEHPNVREELNVVPVEDAMAVSENAEKRALLLQQLKKDLNENYRILLAAENDEDSESAHYVAAAKMEVYRLQQQRWLECREAHERDPSDPENYHAACDALTQMLNGGVLSPREQTAYRKYYCDLVEKQLALEEGAVSQGEYEVYLACLVELERDTDAKRLWREHPERMKNEACYMKMMELFYRTGERQKLKDCLESLRKDRQVRLSADGLERLRYWTDRLSMRESSS